MQITTTKNSGGTNLTTDGYTLGKYVDVVRAGTGFDSCLNGAITYATINSNTAWYYWCSGGGVHKVGPFYAYTFDEVTFSANDLTVTANRAFDTSDTVTKSDLTVKVQGYNVTDYTITDSSVSASDRTYTLNVGGVSVNETAGHIITFIPDSNSTGSTAMVVKNTSVPIYVPTTSGIYADHSFKGWTLTQNSSTVNYLPGGEFNVDANTTLYAVWEPIVYYTVTINDVSQKVESGSTLSVPSTPSKATEYYNNSGSMISGADDTTDTAVKKNVYTFAGWKNQSSGQFWDFSTPVTSPLNLTPDYSQTVFYKVIFNKNNSSSNYSTDNQWISAGSHVKEVDAPPKVTSGSATYFFAGWNTKQNGTGDYWNFSGGVVNTNVTLYAQWTTVESYNIEFDDNLPDPVDDFVWHTGTTTQSGVAANGYVTAPAMSRVGYVFEGWYTDSNCNASNAYNLNRTLNENNIPGLDSDNDRNVKLYAKWSSEYTSENDVMIDNSELTTATFAAFYSDYVDAYVNNSAYKTDDATPVFRNFYMVNSSGTLVSPTVLPSGLHLNNRTGEIYGVPSTVGDYTFYIRIANDEGKWISLCYPITISIEKPLLSIDMKDDNTGIQKTYGNNDPGFYSDQLAVYSPGTSSVVLEQNDSSLKLIYSYTTEKAARTANTEQFNPANATALKFASDLSDTSSNFVPDSKKVGFVINLQRSSGEDKGDYKLHLTTGAISSTNSSNYYIVIANDLKAETLTYSSGNSPVLTTAPEYVFAINAKPGASYSNAETVEYGLYSSGSDVKLLLTSGSGLVVNDSINVTDAFQSVPLSSGAVSTSGKLRVGTYNAGFIPMIVNTASPKGTSTAADATTTSNYDNPSFSLVIGPKPLTATAASFSVTAGSTVTTGILSKLINFDFVNGDKVALTITSVTLSGTTYDLTDQTQKAAADTALTALTSNSGESIMDISYSSVLTGSDAENYSIAAGTIENAKLYANSPSSGGGGGGSLLTSSLVPVLVNGQTVNAGTQTTGITYDGQESTTVKVDANLIKSQLEAAGSSATVKVPILGGQAVKAGVLTGQMVDKMESDNATLVVDTGNIQYHLSASEFNISKIAEDFGSNVGLSDINVTVEVKTLTGSDAAFVADATEQKGYTLVLQPVEFTVTAAYNGITKEIDTFKNYVQRKIEIPANISPGKITTAVVVSKSGTYHVPTEIQFIDGKYYAVINSLSNSTYALIYNSVEFTDIQGHWAKEAIDDLGARTVVNGVGGDQYTPDRSITRAEFAAILVRALGLKTGMGSISFSDVISSSWYYGYVQTAVGYGLINGYDNESFGPNDIITREQAMTMIARAMTLTGLKPELTTEDVNEILSAYKDGYTGADYSKEGIAACVKTGVVTGKKDQMLDFKTGITRAEMAVIIERFLQKSKLI